MIRVVVEFLSRPDVVVERSYPNVPRVGDWLEVQWQPNPEHSEAVSGTVRVVMWSDDDLPVVRVS